LGIRIDHLLLGIPPVRFTETSINAGRSIVCRAPGNDDEE
jgi:hypothetical protein